MLSTQEIENEIEEHVASSKEPNSPLYPNKRLRAIQELDLGSNIVYNTMCEIGLIDPGSIAKK